MADMEIQEYGAELRIDYMDAFKVASSFVPVPRTAAPAEVAEAIARLLSGKASYIDSEVPAVDGGLRVSACDGTIMSDRPNLVSALFPPVLAVRENSYRGGYVDDSRAVRDASPGAVAEAQRLRGGRFT